MCASLDLTEFLHLLSLEKLIGIQELVLSDSLADLIFYRSAGWAQRGIVVPFVRRRLRTHSFGYYTNMGQQIKFIIHTNIQPLLALFLLKVKFIGQGQRFKIILVNAIT